MPRTARYFGLALLLMGSWADAWESANTTAGVSIMAIGQSIRPSVLDEGEGVPRGANGKAYLEAFSFTVQSGPVPTTIYFHSSLPPAASPGLGAFASATDFGGNFFMDPPIELPYDEITYIVFEFCANMQAGLVGYSGGNMLEPDGGCPPAGRTTPVVTSLFDITFTARFINPNAPLVADYRFDKGLGSSFNSPAAQPLIDLGTNSLVTDDVLGQTRSVLNVISGTGLEGDLSQLLSADGYTLVMLARLNQVDGGRKLIDFSGLSDDNGLYVQDQRLVFRGGSNSPSQLVKADVYHQIVLQRDDTDQGFSPSVNGFVDGLAAFFFNDASSVAEASNGNAFYLRDDKDENTGGGLARLRVYDGRLLSGEISRLTALPPPAGADDLENDDSPLTADSGPNNGPLVSVRNFHTANDEDWVFAGARCYGADTWYTRVAGLQVASSDPRFEPLVEVYGPQPPVGVNPQPIASYGTCGQSGPLHFLPDGFVRIRNCPNVNITAGNPVEYTVVTFRPDFEVCGPVALVTGQVVDAATMNPVPGVFVVGNGVDTSVSAPGTGDYRLASTGGAMTLEPLSNVWFGDPVQVQTMPGQDLTGVTILVNQDLFPDAVDDTNAVDEDLVLNASVAGNDMPGDGDSVYTLESPASNGNAQVASDGSYSYAPAGDFNGGDSFTYRLTDADDDTDVATVTLTVNPVNDPPQAVADMVTMDQDAVPTSADVLSNDTDVDGPALSIVSATQPAAGTVVVAANNLSLSYEPDSGVCNNGSPTDNFNYTASDGEFQSQASVAVTVVCTADRVFADGFEVP